MEEDVAYPTGKEEAELSPMRSAPPLSPLQQLPALPPPSSSNTASFSSPDGELFFLVCSLVRSYGLHDSARQLWQQRHLALPPADLPLLDDAADSADLPLLPHPSLPGDALRLLAQSLLKPLPSLPDDPPQLPPSFLHSGRQALLPHFRSHPLRPIIQSPLSPLTFPTFPTFSTLRALFSLPSPSSLRPSLHSLRTLHATALLPHYRPLKLLLGHLLPVYSVIFDQSGDLCATGSDDHLIKVWSTRSARLLLTLRGHEKEVTDIAISPDNDLLASASWDHSVRVWALRKGGEPFAVFFHHHSNKIWRISFHPHYTPQHRLLFTASMDGSTQIFDLNRPEQPSVTLFAHPQHLSMTDHLTAFTDEEAVKGGYRSVITPHLTTVHHQPNGLTREALALPAGAGPALLASAEPMLLPVAHPSAAGLSASSAATGSALSPEMLCVTHHPSGDEFALGSNDRCIRVYSTATYKLVALLKGAQGEIDQLHYDHAGDRLLGVDDSGEVLIWERVSLSLLYRLLRKERGDVNSTSSSSVAAEGVDERSMDSTDSTSALPALTRFQCVGRLRILCPPSNFPAHASVDGVPSSAAAADNSTTASSSSSSLAELLRPPSIRLTTACWSLDDSLVLTSSSDALIRAWKMPPWGTADRLFLALHRRQRKARTKAIRTVAAATSSPPPVSLTLSRRSFFVHTPLLSPFASFSFHTNPEIPIVRVHPTLPSVLLSAGLDGWLCLWDVDRRVLLRAFHCPTACRWIDGAFSPLGDLIALTSEEGHLAFFGLGSRVPYSQSPCEQFLKEDYHPLVRDEWGYVLDQHTQLPPHLLNRVARVLIRADGIPYDPQPVVDAVPDSTIPRPQPQAEDGELSTTLNSASPSTILAADLARASRLAQLRLQRRIQWQHSHRPPNDMATLAARYRRQTQLTEPIVLDGDEEGRTGEARENRGGGAAADEGELRWWNDRPAEDGHGEVVDVEDDLAEEDDALGDQLSVPRRPLAVSFEEDDAARRRAAARTRQEEEEAESWALAQRLVDDEVALMEHEEERKDEDFLPLPASPAQAVDSAGPRTDPSVLGRASRAEERARRRAEARTGEFEELENGGDDEDVPLQVRVELRRSTRMGRRGGGQRRGRSREGRQQARPVSGGQARVRTIEYKEDDWDMLGLDDEGEGERDDEAGQEWHEDEDEEEEADDSEEDEDVHPRYKGDDGGESVRTGRAYPARRRSERVGAKRVGRRTTRGMSSVESTPVKEGTRRSTRKRRRSSSYREVGDSAGEDDGYDPLDADELIRLTAGDERDGAVAGDREEEGEDGEEEVEWQSSSRFSSVLRSYHQAGDVYELVQWGRRVGEETSTRIEPVQEPLLPEQTSSTAQTPEASVQAEMTDPAAPAELSVADGQVTAAAEPAEGAGPSDVAVAAEPSPVDETAAAEPSAEASSAVTAATEAVEELVIRIRRLQRTDGNGHRAASALDGEEGLEEEDGEASEVASAVEQPRWRWVNWKYGGRKIYRMKMLIDLAGTGAVGMDTREGLEEEPAAVVDEEAAEGSEGSEGSAGVPEEEEELVQPLTMTRRLRSRVVLLDHLDAMEVDDANAGAAPPPLRTAALSVQ